MDKKKYLNIAIIFICIISITLIGTYALKLWTSTNNTELTFRIGEYSTEGMNCKTSEDITVSNIGPIFDYNIDGEIIPFSVLAGINNTEKLYINFNVSSITDNLKEESFKYVLLSSTDKNNYSEIIKGNFKNINSNDTIELISNQSITKSTYYKLIIYIDGNMENPISMQNGSITGNLEVCTSEKFNVTLNVINGISDNTILKVPSGDNAIFNITPNDGYQLDIDNQTCEGILSNTGIYTINNITENKECSLTLKQGNLDTSGANTPDLVEGLIPVMYDGSKWVKADSTNSTSTYQWYDYDNKLWANAVLVSKTNRNTYMAAIPGREIAESDILAFYVWIPRYKYKVWNISKQAGAESTYAYNAKTEGIDIEWETGTDSTGTINCTYNHNVDSANGGVDLFTTTAETCTGSNGDYYTHPAFTFESDNVKGFWIGKFELTGSSSQLTVLPNVNSLRSNTVSSFSTMIQNMQTGSNIYGLSTSRTNTDSHMLTNFEWGAVVYLTNSKYGRCTNGSCTEVTINNCSSYVTGIGANSVSASQSSSTCTTATNKYNGAKGVLASTTGNVTGVYDMSGGAWEYTMGNMSSASGSYTFYPSNSSFASSWYTADTSKYVTTYAYDSSNESNQTAYNRGRLGDATAETLLSASSSGGWYSDYAHFPYSSYSWFLRGGYYIGSTGAGVFRFYGSSGYGVSDCSSRAALVLLSS